MKILIVPAAGQGQRFRDAGYRTPKPLLLTHYAGDYCPMWQLAARAFRQWADEVVIVVPARDYARYEVQMLSLPTIVHALEHQQEGAALTVLSLIGDIADGAEVMIVNSDQFFTDDLAYWFGRLSASDSPDGSMLTFEVTDSDDLRWSYAQTAPHAPDLVTRVAEKQRISSHATAGAYYFRQWRVLRTAICRMVAEGERYKGEFYLAPVYNQLIKAGMTVTRYDVTGGMVCVGTPEQYKAWEKQR